MKPITNDRLKEILDEIDSDTGHTFDEREQRKIIIELLRSREKLKPTEVLTYITDNTDDNINKIINSKETSVREEELKVEVVRLRGLVRRLAKHLDRRRMKEIEEEAENGTDNR